MITILNGKLTIPESERFIGFAGDNLRRTVKFLISGAKEADRIYRLYLTFDDGTVNYFVLPSQVTEEGVVLTWQVLREHIFMSGCVRAQLKAFSDTGVVYHTTTDRFFVGDSAEFSDYFENNNTEFIEYEQRLNELAKTAQELCVLTPFIGENGNWYIYSADAGEYIDSGNPSVGQADSMQIASGAVTADKIASGAVTATKLGQYAVTPMAIQPNAVTKDAIGTGAVTSEKIASGAVTEDKLADNCIDVNHLKLGAVSPDNLDRAYLRLEPLNTVTGDSSFHNLLVKSSDELSDPFKKVVLFLVRPISEGITANIKKGRCFGFFVSNQEFWFTNINYNITYRVIFDDSSLISVESLNINLAVIKPENDGDDGGEQLKNYIDDNYIGYFHRGGASYPYVFYNFYTPYPYENVQFKIALSSYSLVYFYKRECHLDTDGQIVWTNWQELMARTNVDQSYNPESEAPQSGIAVAEALSGIKTGITVIPDYWQSHLDTRVDNIREAMEKAGRNKSSFLFYSDVHWDNGSKNAPQLLKYLTANTAINKTLYGGDIVSTEPTAETINDRSIMKYLWDWRSAIRDLKHYGVVGNHDDGNATNNIFSRDYVYSFLFAPEENNNIVHGGDTYYYFDDNCEKTRYLCLDTAYEGLTALSTEQAQFINESLISTPANWHIVVITHIWYVPDYEQYDIRPIPLTGLSDTATQLCEILDNYNSRSGEFVDCKAKIEFCIGGHVHRDYVGTTTGGIPIIVCECAGMGYRGEFTASLGTISETAVSGVVADYDNDKLSIIRIGRGNSFEVDLTTGASTEIPDDNEDATPTYTNVLDTVGYQTGYRLNSSGEVVERSDRCVTGLIEAKTGDTVYFKNITTQQSDYGCNIAHYDNTHTLITGKSYLIDGSNNFATWYDNGNLKSFKVGEVNVGFIRLCAVSIDETSIITVNEPIE